MRKKLIIGLLLTAICSLVIYGCGAETPVDTLNGGDKNAFVPDGGNDKTPCLSDTDCPIGERCSNNVCIAENGGEGCFSELDCSPGEACVEGECTPTGDDDDSVTDDDDNDSGGTKDELSVEPPQMLFGGVTVGSSVEQKLKIKNVGARDIDINEVKFDSSTSNEFSKQPEPFTAITLSPGDLAEITVIYTPVDATADYGVLLIVNTSNRPLIEVPLSSSLKGDVDIAFYDEKGEKKIFPKPDGSSLEIDFGEVEPSKRSDKIYIIRNEGNGSAPLTIDSAMMRAASGSDFSLFKVQLLESPTGKAIEAPVYINSGESKAIRFSYIPSVKGVHKADAEIVTNDSDVNNDGAQGDNIIIVALSGNSGIEPAAMKVEPTEIQFGNVPVGDEKCETIIITNLSKDTKLTLDIKFSGGQDDFSLNNPPTEVGTEKQAKFDACFKPSKEGEVSKTLQINSNAPDNPTVEVELKGTGVSPSLSISPTPPVDFGGTVINSSASRVLTLRNNGGGALKISGVTVSGSPAFGIKQIQPSLPYELKDKNDSVWFELTFTPTAEGSFNGEVRVTHNGNADGFTSFSVKGTGILPSEAIIEITPDALAFGAVDIGQSLQKNIVVQNTGTVALSIKAVVVQSTPSDFAVVSAPSSVPSGGADNIVISFAPTKPGDRNDILTIQSDAKNSPTVFVALSGQGVGECMPGAMEQKLCGNCGISTRSCGATAKWGDWSNCFGEGVCPAGTQEEKDCEKCGTQTRTCAATCQWSDWSNCMNMGVCVKDTQEQMDCEKCGTKTRICGATCQWEAWSSCQNMGVCEKDTQEQVECNVCGTQTRTCTSTCQWGSFTECTRNDVDQWEPNDSQGSAKHQGNEDDCDGTTISNTQGTIVPRGDNDWYYINFNDGGLCSIDQMRITLKDIEAGQDFDLAAYHDTSDCRSNPSCSEGSVMCDNSDPTCAGFPAGTKGCKSVNLGNTDERVRFNCYAGGSSDSGRIYVKVIPKTADGGSCVKYSIVWDVK